MASLDQPVSSRPSVAAAPRGTTSGRAPAAQQPPRPRTETADLDALTPSLDQPVASSARPSVATPPAPRAAGVAAPPDTSDLDALMASLEQPAGRGASVAGAARPTVSRGAGGAAAPSPPAGRATAKMSTRGADELDELMGTLAVAPGAAASNRAAPLMSSPNTPAAAAAARPTSTRVGPAGGQGELGALLGSLQQQVGSMAQEASKGTCAYCRQEILGEVVQALGKTFHVDHFVCGHCQEPIGTRTFFELEGLPNCERCYQNLFCPKCAYCDAPIQDRCVSALGKKWHVNHFICTQCLQPFPKGVFFERDGRPYCETCFFGRYAPTCAGCERPITGDCVNALGQQWHPEHFVCTYCRRSFGGEPFFEYQGKPYCEAHYHQQAGALCAGCQRPITGRCISALNKKWHPEHFVCTFCMNPLGGATYSEKQGKPYCKDCFIKLFG